MGSSTCAWRIDFVWVCFRFSAKGPEENRGLHYHSERGFSTLALLTFGSGCFFVVRGCPVHYKSAPFTH